MSRPKGAKASPVRGSARIRKTFTHLILSLPLAGKAALPVPQGGGPQAPSPLSRAGGWRVTPSSRQREILGRPHRGPGGRGRRDGNRRERVTGERRQEMSGNTVTKSGG